MNKETGLVLCPNRQVVLQEPGRQYMVYKELDGIKCGVFVCLSRETKFSGHR